MNDQWPVSRDVLYFSFVSLSLFISLVLLFFLFVSSFTKHKVLKSSKRETLAEEALAGTTAAQSHQAIPATAAHQPEYKITRQLIHGI